MPPFRKILASCPPTAALQDRDVWQAGYRNVVALGGSSLSEAQERLILDAVGPHGKVALMFDEDEAGWKCRDDVLARLSTRVYVRVIPLGDRGRQPDTLNDDDIDALLR